MNQTQERPGISLDDAPECWNLPEKEPTVYWICLGHQLGDLAREIIRDRPGMDMKWYGLTPQDAVRRGDTDDSFQRMTDPQPRTPKQCTDSAIEMGREGVGIFTYEGDKKVCVRYWLVGDPIPEPEEPKR